MNELKEAILNAKSICKINAIMEIAMDSLTGLTAEALEELREIATEQKQAIYNNRYIWLLSNKRIILNFKLYGGNYYVWLFRSYEVRYYGLYP